MPVYIGSHIPKDTKGILPSLQAWDNRNHSFKEWQANCFQLFLGSNIGKITKRMYDKMMQEAGDVRKYVKEHKIKLYAHLPYTINLVSGDPDAVMQELTLLHHMDGKGAVVHVGKYLKMVPEEALDRMHATMTEIAQRMHDTGLKSRLFLETAAGQGTELCVSLEELKSFYDRFTQQEKTYIGICLDTAHVWGAGWEMRSAIKELKPDLVHFNNSRVAHGKRVDRHANLSDGEIPTSLLKEMAKECAELKIPMILETPLCMYDTLLLNEWAGGSM